MLIDRKKSFSPYPLSQIPPAGAGGYEGEWDISGGDPILFSLAFREEGSFSLFADYQS